MTLSTSRSQTRSSARTGHHHIASDVPLRSCSSWSTLTSLIVPPTTDHVRCVSHRVRAFHRLNPHHMLRLVSGISGAHLVCVTNLSGPRCTVRRRVGKRSPVHRCGRCGQFRTGPNAAGFVEIQVIRTPRGRRPGDTARSAPPGPAIGPCYRSRQERRCRGEPLDPASPSTSRRRRRPI